MSAPFSNTALRVPPGFPNILELFSREVIRLQPNDIYIFGMEYFDLLLRIRNELNTDDIAKIGASLDDRYYNNRSFMMSTAKPCYSEEVEFMDKGIPDTENLDDTSIHLTNDKAATIIQSAWRGYNVRKKIRLELNAQFLDREKEIKDNSIEATNEPSSKEESDKIFSIDAKSDVNPILDIKLEEEDDDQRELSEDPNKLILTQNAKKTEEIAEIVANAEFETKHVSSRNSSSKESEEKTLHDSVLIEEVIPDLGQEKPVENDSPSLKKEDQN